MAAVFIGIPSQPPQVGSSIKSSKAYGESDYGLILVTDLAALKRGDKKTFRNIPIDGITSARVNGKEYNFTGGS